MWTLHYLVKYLKLHLLSDEKPRVMMVWTRKGNSHKNRNHDDDCRSISDDCFIACIGARARTPHSMLTWYFKHSFFFFLWSLKQVQLNANSWSEFRYKKRFCKMGLASDSYIFTSKLILLVVWSWIGAPLATWFSILTGFSDHWKAISVD